MSYLALADALAKGNGWNDRVEECRRAAWQQWMELRKAGFDVVPMSLPDPMSLTRAARLCLLALQSSLDTKGVAPSYEELKAALGLKSKSGIHRLICQLEHRGWIERFPQRARAIRLKHRLEAA